MAPRMLPGSLRDGPRSLPGLPGLQIQAGSRWPEAGNGTCEFPGTPGKPPCPREVPGTGSEAFAGIWLETGRGGRAPEKSRILVGVGELLRGGGAKTAPTRIRSREPLA